MANNSIQKQKIETTLENAINYCRHRDEAIGMVINLTGNNTLYYDNGYHIKIKNKWTQLFK